MNRWIQLKNFIRREIVLCAALILAAASSLLHTPKASYIDWQVLGVLLSLMLVVSGLKSVKLLDYLALRLLKSCTAYRQVTLALVGITFAASMFVTNDVALITFVPLTLVIGKRAHMDMAQVIILQTLAANLGSMLTPCGNPQNLFLYAHYDYTAAGFFGVMAWPTLMAVVLIGILIYRRRDAVLTLKLPVLQRPDIRLTAVYLVLLVLNLAAVLHVVDKMLALAVTAGAVLLLNRKLFVQVDYVLLVTFMGFFIFTGNIAHTDAVKYLQSILGTAGGTYLAGALASQFISNVPAAMLLAGFTHEADALLLGVNIGGLGTLIASMASLISYKLFAAEHPYQAASYLKMFLYYNFGSLLLLGGAVYLLYIY